MSAEKHHRGLVSALAQVGCWLLLVVSPGLAQSPSAERTFHASKSAVQKVLHDLSSYPRGKLPVLDGFADGAAHSLDAYQRGHYEYDVQIKSASDDTTTVHVAAKITAWYAGGGTPASSGYRLLKSSGRLESDLLDSLEDKLNPVSATKTRTTSSPGLAAQPLPDSPSVTGPDKSVFNTARLTTAPSSATTVPAKVADPKTAKRLQELTLEEKNLTEILHNQVHPDNLAIVKRSNTPVVAQPRDISEVLFQADAEDEFEVLDALEGWVHIKISGISRGWIRRDYVDLPGAATVNISAVRGDQSEVDLVRQTKEEVGTFPGKWELLDGKQVKIIWVQPLDKNQFGSGPRWGLARSVFRKADAGNPADASQIAGVVVIFDSEDGGMTATTLANLQQWRAGHLSDDAFWKRCWRDPADAFQGRN